ncbi:MAG: NRDE family protein [Aureisphaera sp.]
MCTLTFFPNTETGFILTSNRDESPVRRTLPPAEYMAEDARMIFPKDEVAGGTWLGVSDRNRLVCLLNGGFEPHVREASYRMSRGIIVTSLLTAENAVHEIERFDFEGVEPFTVVTIDWSTSLKIHELVWDGNTRHFSERPIKPSIWSSSLLYNTEMKKKREHWFSNFLKTSNYIDSKALLDFHKNAGEGDPETDLVMNRGFVKTKSISQIEKNDDLGTFLYEDLQTMRSKKLEF